MEDVKIFLRSILVSKQHGVKQGLIEKDYEGLVGERLPWKELGFKNLFDLLTSVPDVAKLEWREDDEDNRVFAVLDGESYTSLHAKRMSVKGFGKGSKALSPDEIKQWKMSKSQAKSFSDSSASSKSSVVTGKNYKKYKHKKNKQGASCDKLPAVNESNKKNMTKLSGYSSSINTIDSAHSSAFATMKNNEFANFKATDMKDQNYYDMKPNQKGLYSLCIKLDFAEGFKHPNVREVELLLSSHFTEPGCIPAELNVMRNTLAFVRYRTKAEAISIIERKQNLQCGPVTLNVTVALERNGEKKNQEEKMMKNGKSNIQSNFNTVAPGLLPLPIAAVPREALMTGLLPLPIIGLQFCNSVLKGPENSRHLSSSPGVENLQQSISKQSNGVNALEVSGKNLCITQSQVEGFNLDFSVFSSMYYTACQNKPTVARDLTDEVKFIVTHLVDASRFWIQLLQQEQCIVDLMNQLQKEIQRLGHAEKPVAFPQQHHIGAARYTADDFWYRCWVLGCNKEKDEIHVFYCDYGNDEIVGGNRFQYIHKSLWSLRPQALPVKLPALEPTAEPNELGLEVGRQKFFELCHGKLLAASVAKSPSFLESHVIGLMNIAVPDLAGMFLEDFLLKTRHLKRLTTTSVQRTSLKNPREDLSSSSTNLKTVNGNEWEPGLFHSAALGGTLTLKMRQCTLEKSTQESNSHLVNNVLIDKKDGVREQGGIFLTNEKASTGMPNEWPKVEEDWDLSRSEPLRDYKREDDKSKVHVKDAVEAHEEGLCRMKTSDVNGMPRTNCPKIGNGASHFEVNGHNLQPYAQPPNPAPLNIDKKVEAVKDADVVKSWNADALAVTKTEMENLKRCCSIFSLKPEKTTKAKITTVESPALFYLEKPTNGLLLGLKLLLDNFQPKERGEPSNGRLLCFKDGESKLRVKVLDLAGNFIFSKKVLLIDIDSGRKFWAKSDDLYLLGPELMEIEEMAMCVSLAGIRTENQVTSLTVDLQKLEKKICFVHFVGKDTSGKHRIEVYEDDKSKSVNLKAVHSKKAFISGAARKKENKMASDRISRKFATISDTGSNNGSRPGANKILNMNNRRSASPFSDSSSQDGSRRSPSHQRISISSDSSYSSDISSSLSPNNGADEVGHHSPCSDGRSEGSSVFGESGSTLIYNPVDYHVISMKSGTDKARPVPAFRPHTPPGSKPDAKSSLDVAARCKELVSSIKSLSIGCGDRDFVRFRPDGSLDRDVIEREVERWQYEKSCLQKYVDNLTETLHSLPDNAELCKNRIKRLRMQIYIQLMSAKDVLLKSANEVESLERELLSYGM